MIAAVWALVPTWARIAIAATIAAAILGSLVHRRAEAIHLDGVNQGITQERTKAAETAVERMEISREAAQQIERQAADGSGSLLYAQCMRSARTPANCQRFLPGRSEDQH